MKQVRNVLLLGLLALPCCTAQSPEEPAPPAGKADDLGSAPAPVTAALRFSYFGEASNQELLDEGWQFDAFDEPFFDKTIEVGLLPSSLTVLSATDSLSVSFSTDGTVAIDFDNGDNNSFASVQLPTAESLDSPGSRELLVLSPIKLSIHGNDNSQFSIDGDVTLSRVASDSGLPDDSGQTCCRVCSVGVACGDSCISEDAVCALEPGCACDG